jgi:hypothetical protein
VTKRVALVTGANKGIGFEIARQIGGTGVTVLLGARNKAAGEDAKLTTCQFFGGAPGMLVARPECPSSLIHCEERLLGGSPRLVLDVFRKGRVVLNVAARNEQVQHGQESKGFSAYPTSSSPPSCRGGR